MKVADVLGPGGVLSRAIHGYETRPSQVDMAEQVADALARRRALIVEAGTGTGKTLAYLVPAIMSGLKVVVSTGTKNLQEQIFRKDIPLLKAELPVAFEAACMKGMSNYLCRRRFGEHSGNQAALGRANGTLDAIRAWSESTASGDRAELTMLSDDSPEWSAVSATVETRLGPRCPEFERCFVTNARRRAQAAQIVIVNHHLFFADLALKAAWPQAQLLPAYEAVIFDEAHQLEDVITDYFGIGVSTLRLGALVRDLERASRHRNAPLDIAKTATHLQRRSDAMFDSLRPRLRASASPSSSSGGRASVTRETWAGEPEKLAFALDNALEEAESALGAIEQGSLADGGEEATALSRRARAIRDDLAMLLEGAQKIDRHHVFWAEERGRTLLLHASPIDVAEVVREKLLGVCESVIFTSATLSTGGSFDFLRARLGLESAIEARVPSPFDYAKQSLLYLPRDLPEPGETGFIEAAAKRMAELVATSGGGAFLLFTSHRQMLRAHDLLSKQLTSDGRTVFLQGQAPKHLLVEQFKQSRGSVLFATASFWEGVDVVGDALALVTIDKLPFQPPDDPLARARSQHLEEQGKDPFMHYHIPNAALQLAQGFGRLIRHRSDRGVVALLDRRATTKGYGRKVLSSLPPDCPRTDKLAEVRAFFRRSAS